MTTTEIIQLLALGVSVVSAAVMLYVSRQVTRVSLSINGRLSQLLELTAKSSHAEGVEEKRRQDNEH